MTFDDFLHHHAPLVEHLYTPEVIELLREAYECGKAEGMTNTREETSLDTWIERLRNKKRNTPERKEDWPSEINLD